ncbi:bifunctional oligoribonuclease/PAP phosphatase NrnA, partial [bacterium]|nr:bifunctional oligoribonuclease/PAP phosphatase NrnA [bacterium]
AEVVGVIREMAPKKIKVSMRSRNDFNVAEFAHPFGGGGHPKASGIRFDTSLEETTTAIITELENTLGMRQDLH